MHNRWGDWGAIGREIGGAIGREIGAVSKPRHLFLSSIYGDKTKESEQEILSVFSIRSLYR